MNIMLPTPTGIIRAVCIAAAFVALPVSAGHSNYLESLTERAQAKGMGVEQVPLLTARPGPGHDAVVRMLRAGLQNAGPHLEMAGIGRPQKDKRITTYGGKASYLEVFTDGSKFRFRGDIDGLKGVQAKLADSEMEAIGKAFIEKSLRELIKPGREEAITYLGSRFLKIGGTDVQKPETAKEEVVASIAIFGREVNGIPVVGSGSKIAVWIGPDREVVGFDVDWPAYRLTGKVQALLPVDRLKRRIDAVVKPELGKQQGKLSRLECGYVDLGATRRSRTGVIQAGCSASYDGYMPVAGKEGPGLRWARVEFIPAGEKVLPDPRWPLASAIARGVEPTGVPLEPVGRGTTGPTEKQPGIIRPTIR